MEVGDQPRRARELIISMGRLAPNDELEHFPTLRICAEGTRRPCKADLLQVDK